MTKLPIIIGVTGGIGSGKSYVCRAITAIGYPVFYADNQAKWLLNNNESLKNEIINLFGKNAYKDNQLNRQFLADIIFIQPSKRKAMNSLVHPAVRNHFNKWCSKQDSKYIFQEAAILFETGSYKLFNKNILITADRETKINRVKLRDGSSTKQVLDKMATQLSDEDKSALADYVITNDDGKMIVPQLVEMFQTLFNLSI